MLWALLGVVAMGLVLGSRFRISALLPATTATVIANVAIRLAAGSPTVRIIVSTVLLVLALESAYLAGLLLARGRSKAGARSKLRGLVLPTICC